jgi:hypothetical protein
MRPLTEAERELFEAIRNPGYDNFALVQTAFAGEDTAVIATVNDSDDGYIVTPVAVLLTDDMFSQLADPMEEVTA